MGRLYRHWLYRLILLGLLGGCLPALAAAQISSLAASPDAAPTTVLNIAAHPSTPLVGQHLSYLIDNSGKLSAAQIAQLPASQWQKTTGDNPNFGFSPRVHWFRLILSNPSPHPLHRLLSIDYPVLDEIQIFQSDRRGLVHLSTLGDSYPAALNPLPNPWLLQELDIPAEATSVLYLRIHTDGSLQLPIGVWEAMRFAQAQQTYLMGQGMYFGALVIMLLYNLFIFFLVRDTSYLAFVLSILFYGLLQGTLQGFTPMYLWPTQPALAIVTPIMIFLYSAAVAWFTIIFLRLPKVQPMYARCLSGYALLTAGLALATPWMTYNFAVRLSTVLTLPGILIAVYFALRLLLRGHLAARYFVLAWITFLITSAALALNKTGVIPNTFYSDYAPQLSHLLICLLLSFALSDRINTERKERSLIKQKLLQNERRARDEKEQMQALQLAAQRKELESRQKAIEALAESRAKSEFLSTMSHEIRTPMNGVLGIAELLRDSDLSSQQRQYVTVIERSGKALLGIINDILDYSKIEAGKLNIESLNFDLDELCLECASMFTGQAESKQIELLCSVAPGTPTLIKSDPTRLRQMLLNLLGNAFKFTQQGHIHLRVHQDTTASTDTGEYLLKFEITDTGIGIPIAAQSRLFQAFSQAEHDTSRKYGGSGLGLSICARLAQLMGGSIGVHSMPGAGSTFWFTIRCRDADAPFVSNQVLPFFDLKGSRVLLVDDSPDYLHMLHEQVQSWGMQAHTAENGDTALRLLKAAAAEGQGFQLVSLDLSMPGMNGLEVAASIKAEPALQPVHCLLLSAARFIPSRAELMSAGINMALQKPASAVVLKSAFRQLLSGFADVPSATPMAAMSVPDNFHLLVADDNPVNQMVIRGMLAKLGVPCEVVNNGREAVNRVLGNPEHFHLILMDCEMPEMDGFQATQAIREMESVQHRRPMTILALTAHALQEHVDHCMEAGMDGHLAKPINLDSLREALQRYMTQHASRQGLSKNA